MKKVIIWKVMRILMVVAFFATISLNSCKKKEDTINQFETVTKTDDKHNIGKRRIVEICHNDGIYIYKIDGHEYICNYNGGITHSETCYCKSR